MLELRVERTEDGAAGEPVERTLSAEEIAEILGPLQAFKALARAALADARWRRTQSFTYDGVDNVPADSALTAVIGAVVGGPISPPDEPITWKLTDSEFRSWSLDQVIAYGLAIRAHVQACFDLEQTLSGLIDAAADHAAVSAIDLDAGWPA